MVKNHEFQSRTSESQFKKPTNPKLKMLGALCNQTVNLKTDSTTLYYSILKLKYSPPVLKHSKGYNQLKSANNTLLCCTSHALETRLMSLVF